MATTTNYNLELPEEGSNPGADLLNANWTAIDTGMKVNQISASLPLIKSSNNLSLTYNSNAFEVSSSTFNILLANNPYNLKILGSGDGGLDTIQNITTGSSPQFDSLTLTGDLTVAGNVQFASKIHGNFFSTASQTISSTTATQSVTYNATSDVEGLVWSPTNPDRVYSTLDGDYLINVSAICDSTSPNKHLHMWAALDGANIPYSNTIIMMPTATTEVILAVSFILDINSGSYFHLRMYGDDTGNKLLATSGSIYGIPWCPSIITTVHKID